jgi:hypothetical protein
MSKMDFSHTSYPCHEYDFVAGKGGEWKKSDGPAAAAPVERGNGSAGGEELAMQAG